jgi:hypothetical protein
VIPYLNDLMIPRQPSEPGETDDLEGRGEFGGSSRDDHHHQLKSLISGS